jgi:hypothetical protein
VPAKSTKPANAALHRDPHVIVDFVFDRGLLSISIKNIGTQPAYDVKVEFSHKLMGLEGRVEISALPLFSQLEFLPGGKEITTYLDRSTSYFRSRQPTQITAHTTYTDAAGEQHSNTIRHNLEIYREIGYTSL